MTKETLPSAALARRRLLLKGVSGGSAALAATVPLKALATPPSTVLVCGTNTAQVCTISGLQSAGHSFAPSVTKTSATGYSPGWWGQTDDNKTPKRTWPTDYSVACNSIFTKSTLTYTSGGKVYYPSLFQVMCKSQFASSDERHWICAWLNAQSSATQFPYSAKGVLDLYNSTDSLVYSNALAFFKNNLENI